MHGTMITLAAKTSRIEWTTPRVAARPTARWSGRNSSRSSMPRAPRPDPRRAVFKVAGIMSESLRNTSALLQNTGIEALPAESWRQTTQNRSRVDDHRNNGTASAHAIARGATNVGTGSAPSTMHASISSFKTIEPSSAARPAPLRAPPPGRPTWGQPRRALQPPKSWAASLPHHARPGDDAFETRRRCPHSGPPDDDRHALDGDLFELADHFAQPVENGPRTEPQN